MLQILERQSKESVCLQLETTDYNIDYSNDDNDYQTDVIVNVGSPVLLHFVQVENQSQNHAHDGLGCLIKANEKRGVLIKLFLLTRRRV